MFIKTLGRIRERKRVRTHGEKVSSTHGQNVQKFTVSLKRMLFCRFFWQKTPREFTFQFFVIKLLSSNWKNESVQCLQKIIILKIIKKIGLPHFYKKPRGSNLKEEEVQCLLQTERM